MKLLHTADWHIGRQLNQNGISLIEDQKHVLQELMAIAKEEAVDGIIIAGDLYDRALPPVEGVNLFNQLINQALFDLKIPVYAITGNHDSAKRMIFGQELFKQEGFYLVSQFKDAFEPIETPEAQIFLLPFIDPIDARIHYQDPEIRDIDQAVKRIVEEMQTQFDPDKAHILVSHFAVARGASQEDLEDLQEQMLSETTRTVGGLATLTSDLFEAFDYVALGHIHTRFASPSDSVVYSGSPLIFNKDEAKRKDIKGLYLLNIDGHEVTKEFRPLAPLKPFHVLEASFEELLTKDFYENYPCHQARFAFEILVEDRKELEGVNIRAQLEEIYGSEIVDLRVKETNPRTRLSRAKSRQAQSGRRPSDEERVSAFYEEMTGGQQLTPYQVEVVRELFKAIKEE